MKKLILLKIGGGVITDKTVQYGLREEVLIRLAHEIGDAWQKRGETRLIIGNGAGSFAHYSAHKYRTMEGFVNEESRIGMGWVRHDAVKLNQIVFEQWFQFMKEGKGAAWGNLFAKHRQIGQTGVLVPQYF